MYDRGGGPVEAEPLRDLRGPGPVRIGPDQRVDGGEPGENAGVEGPDAPNAYQSDPHGLPSGQGGGRPRCPLRRPRRQPAPPSPPMVEAWGAAQLPVKKLSLCPYNIFY